MPANLSLRWLQFDLPGVFAGNQYASVNYSLWTLQYEAAMYLAVLAYGLWRRRSLVLGDGSSDSRCPFVESPALALKRALFHEPLIASVGASHSTR